MKLWHRHGWKLVWVHQGRIHGIPVTFAGYKCECHKVKTVEYQGFWTIKELSP